MTDVKNVVTLGIGASPGNIRYFVLVGLDITPLPITAQDVTGLAKLSSLTARAKVTSISGEGKVSRVVGRDKVTGITGEGKTSRLTGK